MHPQTQAIATFETNEDARRAGHTVKLSEAEAKVLYATNRKERRAKLAELRRERKKQRKRRG